MDAISFEALAAQPSPPLDAFVLALAAEFGDVDRAAAGDRLDQLGREVADSLSDDPRAPHREAAACRVVLCDRHGFAGDAAEYSDPRNSMLDGVLERRAGLPITLSVVWVEVARRAGIALSGVGLPGHFVVGHFGADPPLLIDPFNQCEIVRDEIPPPLVRPWSPHEIVVRMLNNLVASYSERGDLSRAIHGARLRLPLTHGSEHETCAHELTMLEARLN